MLQLPTADGMLWPHDLQPLRKAVTLQQFPVWALPPVLQDWCIAQAEALQVPQDMCCTLVLAVMASAAQGRATVCIAPQWSVPLNLFVMIILPPGERKSSAMSQDTKPIIEYEKAVNDALAEQIREYNVGRAVLERAARKAAEAAGNGKIPQEKAIEAQRELDDLEPVIPLQMLADDVSLEALTSIIAQQGRVSLFSAEGGFFTTLAGRYNAQTVIDPVLKAWDGEWIRVNRVGRKTEYIEDPSLTLGFCVQPIILQNIVNNPNFDGQGLLGRFLFALPVSRVGSRKFTGDPIPEPIITAYYGLVAHLLGTQTGTTLTVSDEAYQRLERYSNDLERGRPIMPDGLKNWSLKLEGQIGRIAGLLHLADQVGTEISGETMRRAIAIGDFFLSHASAVFNGNSGKDDLAPVRYLWRKLRTFEGIGKRDLFERVKGTFKTVAALDDALALLEDYGYITVIESTGRGRHSTTVLTNPNAREVQV